MHHIQVFASFAWRSHTCTCFYADTKSGLGFNKKASFKNRFKQSSELWLALKLKCLKTMEKSFKNVLRMTNTSVNNVVGPLPAGDWCDVTFSAVSSESYPPSRHVGLMGNTALAKLPSKVQVGLFLCLILWDILPFVCSSAKRHVQVDSCRSFVSEFAMFEQKRSMFKRPSEQ